MFDIKKAETDAKAEIAEELGKKAKEKIKDKLRQIAQAEKIVANLRHEYDVLMTDIGSDVG